MFKSLLLVCLLSVVVTDAQFRNAMRDMWNNAKELVHPTRVSEFSVKNLDGQDVSLQSTAGRCVLIINTGSGCGLTNPNMKYLNKLTERFPELVILAFPSDSFNQEKKNENELKDFFFNQWQASYAVFGKVDVKENTDSELYKFLIKQSGKGPVIWNYGKYLVQKDGRTLERYGPQAGAVRGLSSLVDLITGSGLDQQIRKCLKS